MAGLKELPLEKRLNSRLKHTDFGVVHRIEQCFDQHDFSTGFDLSTGMHDKIGIIATELQKQFFGGEEIDTTEASHEPFYFACAVVSIIECRPRIALVEPPIKIEEPEQPNLDRIDEFVRMYLQKNPYVDTLISTYADRIGDLHNDEARLPTRLTFPRLFSGMTFFLLECDNAREYANERAVVKGQAMFEQMLNER